MSRSVRPRPPWFVATAALVGVVLGHGIAYRIAFPVGSDRRAIIAHSGHGYWFAAVMLAAGCAVIACSGTVVEHVRRALGRRSTQPIPGARSVGLRLAVIQSVLFIGQETLERVRVGEPLSTLGRGGFLLIGISVQVAVALAIALVLKLLGRTAEAIARAITSGRHEGHREGRRVAERSVPLVARTSATPFGPRAPPLRTVC